ncbi:hypothetical protein BKA65DRAFT_545019 [Rhexocercosporidium sp. MPI-PUGE-AT-0058]|nr:hypothetical protein BKA65DRAFT_545019 [Rhexocercosporidium sp. MPI-PUGE-AT-0058]
MAPPLIAPLESSPLSSENNELIIYARRCVQSATILIHLCDEIVASNYPLSASWVAQHFLSTATLIVILDMKRASTSLEEFISVQESVTCIKVAERLLWQSSNGAHAVTRAKTCRIPRPLRSRGKSKISQEFKHDPALYEARARSSCERVLSSSDIIKPVAGWGMLDHVAAYGADHTSEDDGSLTEMMTEHNPTQPSHPAEAAYQRNVSLIS